jgi:hypothetical protein
MNATIYTPSAKQLDDMMSGKIAEPRREELKNFQTLVKGNRDRLLALCEFSAISGEYLEPCCGHVDEAVLRTILEDAVKEVVRGKKVNGKAGQWSAGFMGSRWFDMDAKKYGVTYVRAAFHSKKFTKEGKWNRELPYAIHITVEKAR